MKASKKLIGASAALIAALAVSVGSTYAWFTTNDSVTVSGIEAKVTTGTSSLEVARIDNTGAVQGDWGYDLSFDELNLFESVKLDALTSGKLDPDHATSDNGKTLYKRDRTATADTDSYIEFYLKFRVLKAGLEEAPEIVLSTGSTVTSEDSTEYEDLVKGWTTEATKYGTAVNTDTAIAAKAQNAMRGAFVPATGSGSLSLGKSEGVWNPQPAAGYYQDNLAKDYELHINPDGNTEIEKAYADTGYTDLELDTTKILTLGTEDGEYYTGMMCVRFWIEGTDGDCFNNIFDDTVKISLTFALAEAA